MMVLLLILFFLLFNSSEFVGVFLYLVMFMFLLSNFEILGIELMKGDLYYVFGSDYISFYMILLLLWLVSLILILFYSYLLFFFIYFLMLSLMLMFFSMNLLYLFIYFEFSMIPMFFIIMIFGSMKERYSAILYMFIYTMVSSLPMLLVLLMTSQDLGGVNMDYLFFELFSLDLFIENVIIFMFLVKVPMFMVYIWLPKAHVEAPVFGSMVLASVMLKMGGYGVLRCIDFMELGVFLNDFYFCLFLCGGLLIGYFCLFQLDLKVLVAYSSIIHMGMMLGGFFSCSEMGYKGGIIMMLSHGVCSSCMFYLVNEVYKITGSRLLMFNKGIMAMSPILANMWLLCLVNNLGVPPCFGILGEFMLVGGCLSYSTFVLFMFFLIIFFVSCFVMNMYGFLIGGAFISRFANVSLLSYYGGFMHLFPMNFFIFFIFMCL